MRKTAFYIFCFALLLILQPESILARITGPEEIDTLAMRRHLSFLASDSLQGRSPGTPVCGLCRSADYIRDIVSKQGLTDPLSDYFQHFKLFSTQSDTVNSSIEISGKTGQKLFRTKKILAFPSYKNLFADETGVVFAGFGYSDSAKNYSDFANINPEHKVVIFSGGTPAGYLKNEPVRWNHQVELSKVLAARKAGAAGIIIFTSLNDTAEIVYNRLNSFLNRESLSSDSITGNHDEPQFIVLSGKQAADLPFLKEKADSLLKLIATEEKPHSAIFNDFSVRIDYKTINRQYSTKNIVAVVEGSDPVLKNECVVFMAHYDHLGSDKSGAIYNGADDNASGCVVLLELAKVFAELNKKPARSIVFLWVTNEETGMQGSQFYAANPVFPMQKTVACINLDMVGRVYEPRDSIWNKSPKKVKESDGIFALTNDTWPGLKEICSKACEQTGLIPDYSLPKMFLSSSDHYSFHKNGVPVLSLSTGYHADYHKITDETGKINFAKMKQVAELCCQIGIETANYIKPDPGNNNNQ